MFRWLVSLALRTSAHTVTGSQATRDDILARFPVASDSLTVVPLAADPDFTVQPADTVHNLRQRYRLWDPFVLYVGSNQRHKNLVRLVEAWAEVAPRFPHTTLAVAGSWIPTLPQARIRAEELGLGENVIRWLGPISEQDLPSFYGRIALRVPQPLRGLRPPVIEKRWRAELLSRAPMPPHCPRSSAIAPCCSTHTRPPRLQRRIARALGDEALRGPP